MTRKRARVEAGKSAEYLTVKRSHVPQETNGAFAFTGTMKVQFFRNRHGMYETIDWIKGTDGWIPTKGVYQGELPIDGPV